MSNTKTTKQKYIITDPCYIIDDKQYQAIGEALGWTNFTVIGGAKDLTYDANKKETFDLVKIMGTPHGDGSTQYEGQWIGVDAGMLCIAYKKNGWKDELHGAVFETEADARKALKKIIRRF